ncbi:unnamed protein product [Anisakis simplex]|uniref:Geminin n=1 Tax=Anisakis simplex TaxID=6269 RepID=A0A0M3K4F8_ANISI|nr:unnamed protein product [Anisakis simplex]
MEKPLKIIDENASSSRLQEQLDAINKSVSTDKFVTECQATEDVETETDISLKCSAEDSSPITIEKPDEKFWRSVAEDYSEKLDDMRRRNKELEDEIRIAELKKEKLEKARDELLAVVKQTLGGNDGE